jgi:hypothetical protein
MAESYARRWGQIIGLSIEAAIFPLLLDFVAQYGLYLDSQGPRPARPSHDVIWIDQRGNRHKLDFVLERGGASDRIGLPVASCLTALDVADFLKVYMPPILPPADLSEP